MAGLLTALKRLVKVPLEARYGRIDVRLAHQRHLAAIPAIGQALETMRKRWPALEQDSPPDAPVFILSAGWRSGSTLLQRLVMSDPGVLVWGEPYANCDYLGALAASLRIFTEDYPTPDWFVEQGISEGRGALSEQWIANLYPEVRDLLQAHRAMFDTLYGAPARRYGYTRWGFKEVRYGIEHARYLRLLFPAAKFLFLYRSPYAAWRSYRIWRSWYYRWPERPIITAREFGALWQDLMAGYLEGATEVGAQLVKYEDLAGGRCDLAGMGDYLGLALRPEVLAQKVEGRGVKPDPVPRAELRFLEAEVGAIAGKLGYTPVA